MRRLYWNPAVWHETFLKHCNRSRRCIVGVGEKQKAGNSQWWRL